MDPGSIRDSRGFHAFVVGGLITYGLLHLLIAWIALQVAFGRRGDASSQGALHEIAKQPLGDVLLWVMSAGLAALALWQVAEALTARREGGTGERVKHVSRSVGRAIVYAALAVLAATIALGGGEHSGAAEESVSAKLLALPAGRVLVVLLALVVAGVGVSQVVKGVKRNFVRDDLAGSAGRLTRALGTTGYIAKGVSLGVIAALFALAATTYDPGRAGGLDAAFSAIRDRPFGPVLLTVMAAGFACFGLFCFSWARHART